VTSLDLALVGNGALAALIAPRGEIVWACFPRFDGDPVFCTLLRERQREDDYGLLDRELVEPGAGARITRRTRRGGADRGELGASARGWPAPCTGMSISPEPAHATGRNIAGSGANP
jgi:hypothetical protein